ncbi:MAG: aminotransferase class V-fold PLP-dependent enzyme [Pseudomonadota bacterium]
MTDFALVQQDDLDRLTEMLAVLAQGFNNLPHAEPMQTDQTAMRRTLEQVARLMHDNYPYAHPLYAGQMLKPPHPVARIAYQAAMWINPNNHALDGGRASSTLEKQAVAGIATMFELHTHLGHLTSSGTLANLEALWIARETHPSLCVASSAQAHYTHARISSVLALVHETIPADDQGRMSLPALEALAKRGQLGTVIATAGTTSFGNVDPIADIVELAQEYGFRVHVDAAYGGYFRLASRLQPTVARHFDAISAADSIAIDPHKHGLQPYGCGCVLFRDPAVGRHYRHDSPYTYFTSDDLHLGEISLECSRAGAAAVALWATQQTLPLVRDGAFATSLDNCLDAAQTLHQHLSDSEWFTPLRTPELDIIVWAVNAADATTASSLAQRVFDLAAVNDLHLALIRVDAAQLPPSMNIDPGAGPVTCLRSCLMKPEHLVWVPQIWQRLTNAVQAAVAELPAAARQA